VTGVAAGRPLAILIWAAWSRPAILEKRLLGEVAATGSALGSRIRVVTLDIDSVADAPQIDALGGALALPVLYLVASDGVVRRRFVGWPARNPSALRRVLVRELTALASR
jgi:hypothetical protein